MTRFERVNPILRVRDVEASLAYWTGCLGFKQSFHWDAPASFAGAERDGIEVMFSRDGQGEPGTWLTIWVDDVDGLYQEYRASGAEIRRAPVTLPWGVREMNVADPDGHRIRFSTLAAWPGHEVPDPFGPDDPA
jgi:catechol 2,3-dioxygenase-like lactoylglutathione lyase family enzyme